MGSVDTSSKFGARLGKVLGDAEDLEAFQERLWDMATGIQDVLDNVPKNADEVTFEDIGLVGDAVEVEHTIRRTNRWQVNGDSDEPEPGSEDGERLEDSLEEIEGGIERIRGLVEQAQALGLGPEAFTSLLGESMEELEAFLEEAEQEEEFEMDPDVLRDEVERGEGVEPEVVNSGEEIEDVASEINNGWDTFRRMDPYDNLSVFLDDIEALLDAIDEDTKAEGIQITAEVQDEAVTIRCSEEAEHEEWDDSWFVRVDEQKVPGIGTKEGVLEVLKDLTGFSNRNTTLDGDINEDIVIYEDAGELLADMKGRAQTADVLFDEDPQQMMIRGKEGETLYYVSASSDPNQEDPWTLTISQEGDRVVRETRIETAEECIRLARDVIEYDLEAEGPKAFAPPENPSYVNSETMKDGMYRIHLKKRKAGDGELVWDWEVKTGQGRRIDRDWGYPRKDDALAEAERAIEAKRDDGAIPDRRSGRTSTTSMRGKNRSSWLDKRTDMDVEPDVV